jgi:deoxyribodipyrimidine photo-lyase
MTGIPWVDAGMRELLHTGYMQNRLRMNVAMYLAFYLKIDWTLGEKHFAKFLVDYDYSNNLGGWLWSTSWEVYSNDIFRIFSMSSQMKRFDPEGKYVKRWVPEVEGIPSHELYNWSENWKKYETNWNKIFGNYPKPLINE